MSEITLEGCLSLTLFTDVVGFLVTVGHGWLNIVTDIICQALAGQRTFHVQGIYTWGSAEFPVTDFEYDVLKVDVLLSI